MPILNLLFSLGDLQGTSHTPTGKVKSLWKFLDLQRCDVNFLMEKCFILLDKVFSLKERGRLPKRLE